MPGPWRPLAEPSRNERFTARKAAVPERHRRFLSSGIRINTPAGERAPAKLAGTGMQPALHCGAWGQIYPQIQPAAGSTQGEQVIPRR